MLTSGKITMILVTRHKVNRDMRAFLRFQGFRAGLLSELTASRQAGLRIVSQAGPAVSPADKPRKDSALPPAQKSSHISSNNQMDHPVITYNKNKAG